MAFYQDEDENQLNQNQQPGVQNGPGSAIIDAQGAAPTASSPQKTNAPDRPGNFVNLQTYLDANKPQAAKLGDQTAGVINNSANQARSGVSALNQESLDKVIPTNPLSPDVSGKLQSGAETLSGDERNTIKKTALATYNGPRAVTYLTGYQAAADASNKAQANIDNSGTEQGRMNLVSQINSKPRTQGENVFDNALLQAGGGREKLAQSAAANTDIKGGLDAASQAIQDRIGRADDPSTPDVDESAGAIGQTNKAQADATKQIQDALNAWKGGFQPKVSQAQQAITDMENRVSGDIGDNPMKLDEETMNLLGLNRGDRTFGLNFGDYLNQVSPSDVTAANIASPEDYARYAALADLSGEQNPILNPDNASQAGTAPQFSANQTKLRDDINKSQADYEGAYGSAKTGVLNPSYLQNQTGGYESYGEQQLGAGGLGSATPEQLESYWLPAFKQQEGQTGSAPGIVQAIEKSLADWRANQKYNNIVNGYGPNADQPQAPTFPGRIIHR